MCFEFLWYDMIHVRCTLFLYDGVPYIYIYIMPNLNAGCSYVVLDTAAIFGHFGGFFCSWQEKSYMAEKN